MLKAFDWSPWIKAITIKLYYCTSSFNWCFKFRFISSQRYLLLLLPTSATSSLNIVQCWSWILRIWIPAGKSHEGLHLNAALIKLCLNPLVLMIGKCHEEMANIQRNLCPILIWSQPATHLPQLTLSSSHFIHEVRVEWLIVQSKIYYSLLAPFKRCSYSRVKFGKINIWQNQHFREKLR